jgi:hypothetical protein
MKKFLLLLAPAALALAACGSSGPTRDASQPLVFVTSQRTHGSDITECLESRLVAGAGLVGGRRNRTGRRLGFGHRVLRHVDAGQRWDSVIKVMRPANAPDDPPEPEMRFDIARCAT